MMQKQIIYITGLPQSGAPLLCQLLEQHPHIDVSGHHSPLCQTLVSLRHQLSHEAHLLGQLNQDFDTTYCRLLRSFQGFMDGWFAAIDPPSVVDHNPEWLRHLETLQILDPNCKLLVCVRELGQILGAIEQAHQNTRLLDFDEPLADLTKSERAARLCAEDGIIGSPLNSLEGVRDYAESLQQRLYYVVFEHLVSDPVTVMNDIFDWFKLPPHSIDPTDLKPLPPSHNSYQRGKDRDAMATQIIPPTRYKIPDRYEVNLRNHFAWFYETFYPGLI